MPDINILVTLSKEPGKPPTATMNGRATPLADIVRSFGGLVDNSTKLVVIDAAGTVTYDAVISIAEAAWQDRICHVWVMNRVRRRSSGVAAFEMIPARRPCVATSGSVTIDDRHPITIDVYASGQTTLDGRVEQSAHLYDDVQAAVAYHRLRPEEYSTKVFLGGETRSPWSAMVTAFDAAEQAGSGYIRWFGYEPGQIARCKSYDPRTDPPCTFYVY
ncbi:MAG TPA: hypothetical protein VID24_02935 [Candidatus Eremiobacteraceae bacterium]